MNRLRVLYGDNFFYAISPRTLKTFYYLVCAVKQYENVEKLSDELVILGL